MYLRELSQTKSALGGDVSLSIVSDITNDEADKLFAELWRQIFVFERSFSRFLPMSELTLFNKSSGLKTKISPEFRSLLVSAKQFGEDTKGLFNPFVVPELQRIGYIKSALAGHEHDAQTDYTDRRVVGVEQLGVGDNWAKIPYKTALDIGGCGKGYLADKLSEFLDSKPVKGYWLSLGGDIVTNGVDENGARLTLSIQDSRKLDGVKDHVIECPIGRFSTATSGTFRRQGQNTDSNWHHIIDPKTLEPAKTDINMATICADNCVSADILASCAIILGSQKAPSFLRKHGVKSYLLQCHNKQGKYFEKVYGSYIKKISVPKLAESLQNA